MEQTNQYIKQYPELFKGKKMMYVHGFGSSGQSGTVSRIRTVFPNTTVIAPDLPVHPQEALDLLHHLCATERPDLIIGTSMGGMYTEQLRGFDRICVNAALEIAETMKQHGLTGTQQFQNPRLDGIQEFYVDKAMVKEYREASEHRFESLTDDDRRRVYGLFGDDDDVVDTFGMFAAHYPQALHFHGEHRMNDRSFMHSVVPVVRWIDDHQEGRERPIIYIGIETLKDGRGMPASSCQKAIRLLIEHYQVYFVAPTYPPGITPSILTAATCFTATTSSRRPRPRAWPHPLNMAATHSRPGMMSSTISHTLVDNKKRNGEKANCGYLSVYT